MSNNIKIFDTPEKLAIEFAQYFKKLSETKPFFNTCLSGGSTPKIFLEQLAKIEDVLEWDYLSFYWGDERCVSPLDSESNYLMTKNALFDRITIPDENIHRIKGENYPSLEVVRYAYELLTCLPQIKKVPQFDLLILGLGDDGHTASIFPNNILLFDSENLFEVSKHPESQQKRITITGKVIKNAHKVVFLVTGKKKAEILKDIHQKSGKYESYPAWLVQNIRPDVEWWLDADAASMLKT